MKTRTKIQILWNRIVCRLKFGPDTICDRCLCRTEWDGNVYKPFGTDVLKLTVCNECWCAINKYEAKAV